MQANIARARAGGGLGEDELAARDVPVGGIINIGVNGTKRPFLVVNQRIPQDSAIYDESCNGTWMLMRDLPLKRQWNASEADYGSSAIATYLDGTFFGFLEDKAKAAIRTANIPYNNLSAISKKPVRVFLLSVTEVASNNNGATVPNDGAAVNYFIGAAMSKRAATLNGVATGWWTRSTYRADKSNIHVLYYSGNAGASEPNSNDYAIRPAFILNLNTRVTKNSDGTYSLA